VYVKICIFNVKIVTMNTSEIIKEIQNLPIQKRIYVLEKTIHSIRQQSDTNQLKSAADMLLTDYKTDNELIGFTILDFENFYEAR
jgi:hypothetical protein